MTLNSKKNAGDSARSTQAGLILGTAAYLWWGFAPIYFKAVAHIPALEILAHRVVWAVVMLNAVLLLRRGWGPMLRRVRHGPTMLRLLGSTVLIAVNWLVFIWAVANDRLVDASLGYYINPLINVVLGVWLLGERLRRPAMVSVALAAIGVTYLAVSLGSVPWVSLVLAISFAFYGLLRKTVNLSSLEGLAMETTLLAPWAAAYLVFLTSSGHGAFGVDSPSDSLLLAAAGIVTAVPLLCFAAAARRLRLATVGFLQYLAPSCQFLLAVVLYNEPLSASYLVAFACTWTALAVYSTDAFLQNRIARRGGQLQ